jgi:hypothetical protein
VTGFWPDAQPVLESPLFEYGSSFAGLNSPADPELPIHSIFRHFSAEVFGVQLTGNGVSQVSMPSDSLGR